MFFSEKFKALNEKAISNVGCELSTLSRGKRWINEFCPVEITDEGVTQYSFNKDGTYTENKVNLKDIQVVMVFKRDLWNIDEILMAISSKTNHLLISEDALRYFTQLTYEMLTGLLQKSALIV